MACNKVTLLGRLGATPELRDLGTDDNGREKSVTSFRIAVQRRMAKNAEHPEADWFNCTAWNGLGKTISTYFDKGSRILVTGRLQNDNWETPEGEKRISTKIIVEDFDFIDTKKDTDNSHEQGGFSVGAEKVEEDLPF